MTSTKTTGYANKLTGAAKEAVGTVFSDNLKAEGQVQKDQGQAEITSGKVQEGSNKLVGAAKQNAGAIFADGTLKREGEIQRTTGHF